MSAPTPPCPNCGTANPSGAAAVCPHCGHADLRAPSWPPPPAGLLAAPPPEPRLVTGRAWGDVTLGAGLSFLSGFLAFLGFVVMPILYFTLKPKYPVFARGIGYGLLASLAVVLGACALCFVEIFKS